MSVAIRLTRVGARNNPCYRVVVVDSKAPRDGKSLETLGTYDPRRADDPVIRLDLERLDWWVSHGARMSDTVRSLAKRERKKVESPPSEE